MLLRNGKSYCYNNSNSIKDKSFKNITKKLYSVHIDFDNSSKEWRKNKINLGYGTFKYKKK